MLLLVFFQIYDCVDMIDTTINFSSYRAHYYFARISAGPRPKLQTKSKWGGAGAELRAIVIAWSVCDLGRSPSASPCRYTPRVATSFVFTWRKHSKSMCQLLHPASVWWLTDEISRLGGRRLQNWDSGWAKLRWQQN